MNRAAKTPSRAEPPAVLNAQLAATPAPSAEAGVTRLPRAPRAPRAEKAERPQRARSTDEVVSPWNDAIGIVLLMVASMLLLALISYDSYDLGPESPLAHTDETRTVTHNFMGSVGAGIASALLYLLGAAGYLLPVCLTWFGVCKLHSKTKV
ncbi:MAG: hypothetical protein RLZZ476_546, partial [Verrucomicrobiota bacterium]